MKPYKINNAKNAKNKMDGKKEEILYIAAKLFRKKGFVGTSIKDITSEIGIQRGSLYSHFDSKERIFLTILHRGIDSLLNGAENIICRKLPPKETLHELIKNHLIHIMENNNSLAIFMQDRDNIQEEKLIKYLEKRDKYEAIMRNVVKEGIEQGDFHNTDIRLTIFIILGACNWVIHWYNPYGQESAEEISRQMASLIVDKYLTSN